MGQQITEVPNMKEGGEVIVPCPKCAAGTAHEVVASIAKSGEDADPDERGIQDYQIIRCKGCKTISFRNASSSPEEYIQVGEAQWETRIVEKLYPTRIESRKYSNDDARYLPPETDRIYEETLQALNNNSPVLAGIGLRALVETVCREKNASGKNLLEKIDDLATQHVLTPSGAAILKKIQTLGNADAHGVKPYSDAQLALGMDVVEHMLDVYILQKLVAAGFD